jgi:hypothetical protein
MIEPCDRCRDPRPKLLSFVTATLQHDDDGDVLLKVGADLCEPCAIHVAGEMNVAWQKVIQELMQ